MAPDEAVLADLNSELIAFYRMVQGCAGAVYDIATGFGRSREDYYRIRSNLPEDPAAKAARFYYLNRLCFNGIYRTNLAGAFNVPYGAAKAGGFPDLNEFSRASELVGRSTLINDDFERVLREAAVGDFCYIDPPYYSDASRIFAEYDHKPFGKSDLLRLRQSMEDLHGRGVLFMLSYQDGPEARSLAQEFHTTVASVRRTVAGSISSRGPVDEIIIRNYQ